jgi:hypothetical protein
MSSNLNKKNEGVDYELVPSDEHEQAWNVRLLSGNYPETLLKYGTISFNEVEGCMTFNFSIVSSPDPDITTEDIDLQIEAGNVLEDIIAQGIQDGSVLTKEREDE